MPRKRTGTIQLRGGVYLARLTVVEDGKTKRPWFSLGTADKRTAQRKLARMLEDIASGKPVQDVVALASGPGTVRQYGGPWLDRRKALGVVMEKDERRLLEHYVYPVIGDVLLTDVRAPQLRIILDRAVELGKARETVRHLRGAMSRLFGEAWRDEAIAENPVLRVKMPSMRVSKRERAILTDTELAQFLASPAPDLELRMVSLTSRCEGGMRTGDLHRWDWTMIGLLDFAECTVPRVKTGTPQVLAVPEVLRAPLRAWWEQQGKPASGPVFPSRRGPRKGQAKAAQNSYARRLRRDLLRAGVRRHACERPDDARPVAAGEACCPAMARDPLYGTTATTLPVDFHSFRRAFNTGLATAGVNVQQAMRLAGHTDAKTHMRYVMDSPSARVVPDAALPRLGTGSGRIVLAQDESPEHVSGITGDHEQDPELTARPKGFEPLTNGLEGPRLRHDASSLRVDTPHRASGAAPLLVHGSTLRHADSSTFVSAPGRVTVAHGGLAPELAAAISDPSAAGALLRARLSVEATSDLWDSLEFALGADAADEAFVDAAMTGGAP